MEPRFTGERLLPGQADPLLEAEHRARYRLASRWLAGRRVLDFGCGEGYGAEILLRGGARRVWGTDIDTGAIARSARHHGGGSCRFAVTDCLRSGLRSHSFEAIVAFEIIEHVPSPQAFLAEVQRLLTADGLLILSTPDKKIYSDDTGFQNPFHVHELYQDELSDLVAEHFDHHHLAVQTLAEGQGFFPLEPQASPTKGDLVLDPGDRHAIGPYLLAFASPSPLPKALTADLPLLYLGQGDCTVRLRRALLDLHREFAERSAWALDLVRQLQQKDEQLLEVHREYDERTAWALSLNQEAEQLRGQVQRLEETLQRQEKRIEDLERRLQDSSGTPSFAPRDPAAPPN